MRHSYASTNPSPCRPSLRPSQGHAEMAVGDLARCPRLGARANIDPSSRVSWPATLELAYLRPPAEVGRSDCSSLPPYGHRAPSLFSGHPSQAQPEAVVAETCRGGQFAEARAADTTWPDGTRPGAGREAARYLWSRRGSKKVAVERQVAGTGFSAACPDHGTSRVQTACSVCAQNCVNMRAQSGQLGANASHES